MYGPAEQVTGELLRELQPGASAGLFAATKVWTDGREAGIAQMNESFVKMGVEVMDLMQIHNLRDWQSHLPVLKDWKAQGRIRYLGVTTSSGRNHAELAELLKREPFDFVQFTYSIENRGVERDLFPIAKDRGIAVLVNRPFEAGGLFQKLRDKPLPGWAAEIDCTSWAQAMLKFVISHPEVTCAIPATGKLVHLQENMAAGRGPLPDAALRERMVQDMLSA
jgi:diketogulonate reductase-like aldo/keto reductase